MQTQFPHSLKLHKVHPTKGGHPYLIKEKPFCHSWSQYASLGCITPPFQLLEHPNQ